MSIEDVAHELYGLAPEEFTSARNARAKAAKAAGDAELAAQVQALRKPTTGAWLLNQFVRQHAEEVQQVLELGAQLRAAQGTLGAEELRALDRQRRQLTHAVAQQARSLGVQSGRRVTNQVADEVEESLRSAMVDPAAGDLLLTGLMVDTFSSTGLEPVDLTGVAALAALAGPAARPPTAPRTTARPAEKAADPRRERRLAEARQAVAEAESAVQLAHEVSQRAREQAEEARQEHERLESEHEEARRRLADLEAQVSAADSAQEAAVRLQDQAARAEASATEAAQRAREQLDRLAEDS